MNGSISIILPMSSIIVQFPVGHGQNNGINFSCTNCIQHNLTQTTEIREEKTRVTEEKNKNQEQKIEIKEEMIKHEEEDSDSDFDPVIKISEYVLYKDSNTYSPISMADSEDVTNNVTNPSKSFLVTSDDKVRIEDLIVKYCYS